MYRRTQTMQSSQPSPSLSALGKQFCAPRFWLIWCLLGWLRLLSYLPMPLLYGLGIVGGEFAYWAHARRRDITWRNLTACFPHHRKAAIRALARRHFHSLAIATFATGVGWWGGRARLQRLTRLRNGAVLANARRRGENIILLTPHFVGLEFGGIYLSTLAPTVTMYQRHKNPLLDALIKQYRGRFGIIQYAHKGAGKSMIELIRRGHQFYYLPDQNPGSKRGVFAPFYSLPAATFASLGRIARLCNATIIPCATRLLPRGRGYEIIFEQPLTDCLTEDDPVREAGNMNRVIEQLITHAPAQYFWSHRRFKTRPPGEPPFYAGGKK